MITLERNLPSNFPESPWPMAKQNGQKIYSIINFNIDGPAAEFSFAFFWYESWTHMIPRTNTWLWHPNLAIGHNLVNIKSTEQCLILRTYSIVIRVDDRSWPKGLLSEGSDSWPKRPSHPWLVPYIHIIYIYTILSYYTHSLPNLFLKTIFIYPPHLIRRGGHQLLFSEVLKGRLRRLPRQGRQVRAGVALGLPGQPAPIRGPCPWISDSKRLENCSVARGKKGFLTAKMFISVWGTMDEQAILPVSYSHPVIVDSVARTRTGPYSFADGTLNPICVGDLLHVHVPRRTCMMHATHIRNHTRIISSYKEVKTNLAHNQTKLIDFLVSSECSIQTLRKLLVKPALAAWQTRHCWGNAGCSSARSSPRAFPGPRSPAMRLGLLVGSAHLQWPGSKTPKVSRVSFSTWLPLKSVFFLLASLVARWAPWRSYQMRQNANAKLYRIGTVWHLCL